MFVANNDALRAVNLLNFADQIVMQRLFAQNSKHVVRADNAVGQLLACVNELAVSHLNLTALIDQILGARSVLPVDYDALFRSQSFIEADRSVDVCDDRRIFRAARLK